MKVALSAFEKWSGVECDCYADFLESPVSKESFEGRYKHSVQLGEGSSYVVLYIGKDILHSERNRP